METKLASLQRSGCQDKISWSRTGAIGYVVDSSIKICYLKCSNGQDWAFSRPSTLRRPQNGLTPFQHVNWGPAGTDLAAIDEEGGISIFASLGNGNFASVFDSSNQPASVPNELESVVGFKWLDMDKASVLVSPAMRNSPGIVSDPNSSSSPSSRLAQYPISQAKQFGPYNPIANRQACIAISRRGNVRLISHISAEEARYYQVTSSLESGLDADDYISHATMKGTRDGSLMVATYSGNGSVLKVYKIAIEWATQKPQQQQNQQQTQHPILPSTDFAKLKITRILKTGLKVPEKDQFLSHLLLIPTLPQKASPSAQPQDGNEIYAVFSSSEKSTVQVYEISPKSLSLHNSFYSLSTKRDSGTAEDHTFSLNLKETIQKEPIIKVEMTCFDTLIQLSTFGGEVDFKPRQNAASSTGEQKPVYTLHDGGFYLPKVEGITEFCLSPNLASYVYLKFESSTSGVDSTDQELKIQYMQTEETIDYNDPTTRSELVVALALRCSVACFLNFSYDDLLCLMKRQVEKSGNNPNFFSALLEEIHLAISFNVEIPTDYQTDRLLMNPSIQRVIAIQMALGTNADWRRDASGRVAWCILNLRLAAFALAFTLRTMSVQRQQHVPPAQDFEIRASQVHALVGLVRWCGDLLSSVAQELYIASLEEANTYYEQNRESVGMALLLGRIPRALLLYILRGIRGLETLTGKNVEQENNTINGHIASSLRRLKETIMTSPVSFLTFEKVISDTDHAIRSIYPNGGAGTNSKKPSDPSSGSNKPEAEQDLIFRARIPDAYLSIVGRALQAFRDNMKPDINVPVLHFYDTSWLGVSDYNVHGEDEQDTQELERLMLSTSICKEKIDDLRKTVLPLEAKARYRRCSRCGSWSQWDDHRLSQTLWTMAFQKNCLCGGNWFRPDL